MKPKITTNDRLAALEQRLAEIYASLDQHADGRAPLSPDVALDLERRASNLQEQIDRLRAAQSDRDRVSGKDRYQ